MPKTPRQAGAGAKKTARERQRLSPTNPAYDKHKDGPNRPAE